MKNSLSLYVMIALASLKEAGQSILEKVIPYRGYPERSKDYRNGRGKDYVASLPHRVLYENQMSTGQLFRSFKNKKKV